jgi:hypothetical protein
MNTGIKKLVFIGGFVAVLGAAWFIADRVEGKKIGETCEYQNSCGGSGECLTSSAGRYCSMACATSAECPSGWRCGDVASETYSGKSGQKTAESSVKMCLRP